MLEFQSFEDVLDFAILQEKAAQAFYRKLAGEVTDPDVRLFYESLVEQETEHERKLEELKLCSYHLTEPDLEALRDSGYLKALPIPPEISLREAVQFALSKERSARMLYNLMADTIGREDLAALFRHLAEQEEEHAEFFQKEFQALSAREAD